MNWWDWFNKLSLELALVLAFLVNIMIYEDGLIELSYEWNSVKLIKCSYICDLLRCSLSGSCSTPEARLSRLWG